MKLPQELPRELNFYYPSLQAKFERVKEYLNYFQSFNWHFFLAFYTYSLTQIISWDNLNTVNLKLMLFSPCHHDESNLRPTRSDTQPLIFDWKKLFIWPWWWLRLRFSKRKSLLPTTVLLGTTHTKMIKNCTFKCYIWVQTIYYTDNNIGQYN